MSSLILSRRSRVARRTASTTTWSPSVAVMFTRPEKLLSRRVPPGASLNVWLTRSVSPRAASRSGVAHARSVKAAKAAAPFFIDRFDEPSVREVQDAGVDGHTDDRVDAERMQPVDFTLRRDPARCGQLVRGRAAHGL